MSTVLRREFLLSASAFCIAPLAAFAQQPASVHRIGFLSVARENRFLEAFANALRELGYIEGKNISITYRSAERDISLLPKLAADLVSQKVEIIVAVSTPGVLAAKKATNVLPIVFVNVSDPIGIGVIKSFARPGGNVTGASNMGGDISAKRLQLLKEAFPRIARVAIYDPADDPVVTLLRPEVMRAAQLLGLQTLDIAFGDSSGLQKSLSITKKWKADSFYVIESTFAFVRRKLLAEFQSMSGVPGMYPEKEYVEAGGLMSYGVSLAGNYRRAAVLIDKILRGANPGDLPAERPTILEFAFNMRTARALRITVPPSVLGPADHVIE